MTNELAPVERVTLSQHEEVIERGLKTFVDVGNALMAIRDGRLYREQFGTFEDYCEQRWGFTDERARLLMRGAEVVGNISKSPTNVGVLPTNEAQARPLASLPPTQQPVAWQRAVETAPNGKVTAAHVQSVVEEMKPKPASVRYAPVEDDYVDDVPAMQLDDEPEGEPEEEIAWTPPAPVQPNRAYKNSSNTPEWYTPQWVMDFAHAVLGEIDLDPASNEIANQTVKAHEYFSQEVDGLKWDWCKQGGAPARVWLNPPYQRNVTTLWMDKLLVEWRKGNIREALVLVAARTDTQWFRKLKEFPRCFIEGRIEFIRGESSVPDDEGDPAGFPSVVLYLGDNVNKFASLFSRIGDVYTFWSVDDKNV